MSRLLHSSIELRLKLNSKDPFYLSGLDNPGVMITNVVFNGNNYLSWSRSVKLTLSTKAKLGFVDGSCVKLEGICSRNKKMESM